MIDPAILPARGGGGGHVKLTPAQRDALARAVSSAVRYLLQHGYGWWLVGGAGLSLLGGTAWYFDWMPAIRQWWER